MDAPCTLIEAVRHLSSVDNCERAMRDARWPGGKPKCPECGSENIGEIKTRRLLRCRDCRRQIYTKHGTIFEDSPLGLDKWLVAVWAIANCKNGISSHELARALGVMQKTAWFMLHRIRTAIEVDEGGKFSGVTDADTTYVGGAAESKHKAKREKVIKGIRAFQALLARVVAVPKDKVEARMAKKRAKRIAQRSGIKTRTGVRRTRCAADSR